VKGTGLGLSIVYAVAKRHGGRAFVESEGTGKGSRFSIELPLKAQ
jgi:signal transduction histidine kinase